MGRHELVQRIAAQSPHLDPRDVEAIVEAVVDALDGGEEEEGGFDALLDRSPVSTEDDDSHSDAMTRFLGLISQVPEEVLDRPVDEVDPRLVRSVIEAVFDSVARSADMLDETVRENRRYRDDFARRSREIEALQRDIDARLQRLVG